MLNLSTGGMFCWQVCRRIKHSMLAYLPFFIQTFRKHIDSEAHRVSCQRHRRATVGRLLLPQHFEIQTFTLVDFIG